MNLSTKLRKTGIEVNEGGRRSATGTHKQRIKTKHKRPLDIYMGKTKRESTCAHTKTWTKSRRRDYIN